MIHNVEKVIVGKRDVIEKAMVALFGGGHLLIEDVPGVGKTMLVQALARTVGCTFMRIQFTPDMLPGDITGVSIFNQKTADFEFRPGPVMANIVLADELNRTSPKTQAALLECMEERSVTVDGVRHALEQPFMVLATQNPHDFQGTFPLPEAQMDRFMMRVCLGYPEKEQEARLLGLHENEFPIQQLRPVIMKEELLELQQEIRGVFIDATMKAYIISLAHETRNERSIRLGVSPRGSVALMRAAQARAWMNGRSYVIPDDIKLLAEAVFAHRLLLSSEAELAGETVRSLMKKIVARVRIPLSGSEQVVTGRNLTIQKESKGRAVQ